MKTANIKMILCLILLRLVQVSQAQSLFIDGKFYDMNNNKIEANFKLISGNDIIVKGTSKKLNVELELGKEYVLIISKDGYVSKTINISTQTQLSENYSFLFDAILNKSIKKCSIPNLTNKCIVVFYDNTIKDFNYYTPCNTELTY